MGIFFFDDRTQLALLMASLVGGAGAALGGCENTQLMDPLPKDMRAEPRKDGRVDTRKDSPWIVDPLPPDGRVDRRKDQPWVVDPLPPDTGIKKDAAKKDAGKKDQPWVVDPLPPDTGIKKDAAKKKDFWIVDPLPVDASAGWSTPAPKPQPRQGASLPLERELRASIHAKRRGAQLELVAHVAGEARSELTYRWKATSGALDHTNRSTARWTPPATKGRHMVQLTVRDGERTISVDAFIYEVR